MFTISHGNTISVVTAATHFNMYVSPTTDKAGEVKVVIGDLIAKYILDHGSPIGIGTNTLAGILLSAKLSLVVDQGRAFEIGTAVTLSMQFVLALGLKQKQIPLFSLSTIMLKQKIDQFGGIRAVSGFTKSLKSTTSSSSAGKQKKKPKERKEKKTFKSNEWEIFWSQALRHSVLLPTIKNSHGPDLLFIEEHFAVMFALKALLSKSKSSVQDIADEVQKCLKSPRDCGVKDQIVLFFLSTQLDENITRPMETSKALVLTHGWWGQKSSGSQLTVNSFFLSFPHPHFFLLKQFPQKLEETQLESAETKFEVPEDCEVVIPSNETLNQFFGNGQLDCMDHFFKNEAQQVQLELNHINIFHTSLIASELLFIFIYIYLFIYFFK